MECVEISNSIYLHKIKVPTSGRSKARAATNHIWIVDRSGSMGGTIGSLIDDLSSKAREVVVNDTVTIGWFSGEGQYDWAIKGFRVTGEADFALVDLALARLKSTLGTTCFSEILGDVDQVIADLSIFSNSFSLSLFTDGYPVVQNYQKEVDAVLKVVQNISGKISSSLLVGYGHYYNKELMSKMAEKIGGTLIHSSSIAQYSACMSEFISHGQISGRVALKLYLDLDEESLVFTVGEKFITALSPTPSGEVLVPDDAGYVYAVSKKPSVLSSKVDPETMLAPHYAAAMLYVQKAKADLALELLGATGDRGLIDDLYNSFSHEEYGKVEEKLGLAARPDGVRFEAGKKTGYLPKADAFCLLDLLDLLSSSYFYPTDPTFRYRRVGKSQEISHDYPKFEPRSDAKAKIGSLTWNDTKLNLSVLTKIDGFVSLLPKEVEGKEIKAEDAGLAQEYPVSVWRNFTIVKDGNLNVSSLPVSVPEDVFTKLQALRLVDDRVWDEGRVYQVHIDRIPVVNRSIAKGRTSASVLCKKVLEEHRLKAYLKALKWLKDQNQDSGQDVGHSPLSELQRKYLVANGVDPVKGLFSPPAAKSDSSDFYIAKTFDIKVAGLSSLPKVEDAIAKVDGGKKPTKSETLVFAGVELFRQSGVVGMPGQVINSWLDASIKKLTDEMLGIRRYVQETKFAVVLGKSWFDEFKSFSEKELVVEGHKFTFELGEQKVFF